MPPAVRRAILEDIERQKLSHNEKQTKIDYKTGRLVSGILKNVEKDDEIVQTDLKLEVIKINQEVKKCFDKVSINQEEDGLITIEKNIEFEIVIGDEQEDGVEFEIVDQIFDELEKENIEDHISFCKNEKNMIDVFNIKTESGKKNLKEDFDVKKIVNELSDQKTLSIDDKKMSSLKKNVIAKKSSKKRVKKNSISLKNSLVKKSDE